MKLTVNTLFCFACISLADAANILSIFPVASPSHQILGNELNKALIKKGHHVTMAAPYQIKENLQNYTEIILEGVVEYRDKHFQRLMSFNVSKLETMSVIFKQEALVRIIMEGPGITSLLNADKKFDLVILDTMLAEYLLGFGHFFEAPTVIVSSFGSMYYHNKMVGNSQPYAYVPSFFGTTDEMSFFERVLNTIAPILMDLLYCSVLLPQQQMFLAEYFPNAPPLEDLFYNVSLILLNGHYSVVETPRPYMPNMIPVGGFHIQPQTLPEDLQDYLDGAKEGAVLLSLGSNVISADLPQSKIDIILNTFAKFPQRFLWKFERDDLDVPKNVKIYKWLPQRAVLDHPNTKAFISHGGLLSITEAVYYGVPVIGVPVFGDQDYNVANAVHKKFALQYNLHNLSEETLSAVLREILENPVYKENIARRSSLLREQPVPPLDLAVYWIEHVIKYKGTPHLQSAAVKLSWYQAYLLDVIAFLAGVSFVIFYVNYIIVKRFIRFICIRFCTKQKLKSV